MEDPLLMEVNIADVSITNVGFALFFKPKDSTTSHVVPIFIGPMETFSISNALDGITPPRPNTHDLMLNVIKEMNGQVLHIVINEIIGNVFYARIVIKHDEQIVEIDARPSDSVALAIRIGCPMFMHKKVFLNASVQIDEISDDSEEKSEQPEQKERSELEKLQEQLQSALEAENYEEAARLRDRIRDLQSEN